MAFKVHTLICSTDPAIRIKRPRVWKKLWVGVHEIGGGAAWSLLVGLETTASNIQNNSFGGMGPTPAGMIQSLYCNTRSGAKRGCRESVPMDNRRPSFITLLCSQLVVRIAVLGGIDPLPR